MNTLVLGASPDPSRYANMAIHRLRLHNHEVIAIGARKGTVSDVKITDKWPETGIDTVTMYVGPARQPGFYQRIIDLSPRRVLFNPGTENKEFYTLLRKAGIEVVEGCTLIMLNARTY